MYGWCVAAVYLTAVCRRSVCDNSTRRRVSAAGRQISLRSVRLRRSPALYLRLRGRSHVEKQQVHARRHFLPAYKNFYLLKIKHGVRHFINVPGDKNSWACYESKTGCLSRRYAKKSLCWDFNRYTNDCRNLIRQRATVGMLAFGWDNAFGTSERSWVSLGQVAISCRA